LAKLPIDAEEDIRQIAAAQRLFAEIERGLDDTIENDASLIGETTHHVDVVTRQKNGAARRSELFDHLDEDFVDHRIEADGRLIENP